MYDKQKHVVHMVCIAIVLAFTLYSSIVFAVKDDGIHKVIGLIVFVVALFLAVQRDTYLPFLYDAVFPHTLVKETHVPDHANVQTVIAVDEPDGTRIAYWGAMPSNTVGANPQEAYATYDNNGVAEVHNGKATLHFRCPSKYNIPWGVTLDRHVHYRVISKNGMMSRVNTVFVKC